MPEALARRIETAEPAFAFPAPVPAGRQAGQSRESAHHRIIEPSRAWQAVDFRELWGYRELIYFLVWRDIKVRYKQTILGAGWAIIQPVMTMVVFSIFFGRFGGMAQNVDTAYPIFVYAALLPWTFFAQAVSQAGQSLISSSHLISKVYFPRLIIPVASAGAGLVDLLVSCGAMLGLMLFYGISVTAGLMLVPLFTLGTMLAALGTGILLAALVAAYRDFRYVMTFLVQLWMFASPVAYPVDVIPERWRLLYCLNPMAGMISGFRSSILGEPFYWSGIAVSTLVSLSLVCGGVLYFRRVERRLADII